MIKKLVVDNLKSIDYAKDYGLKIEFSAEDATRTEKDFLYDIYNNVVSAGADFLNIPDTKAMNHSV